LKYYFAYKFEFATKIEFEFAFSVYAYTTRVNLPLYAYTETVTLSKGRFQNRFFFHEIEFICKKVFLQRIRAPEVSKYAKNLEVKISCQGSFTEALSQKPCKADLFLNLCVRDGQIWRPKKLMEQKDERWKQDILKLVVQVRYR